MEQEPFTTPFKYHLRRTSKLVLVLALLLLAKPAFSFLASGSAPDVTSVSAQSQASISASTGLISGAAPLFEDVLPSDPDFPELNVTAALVTEFGAAKPLLAYRTNARWPLASVSKLMTAVVAIENLGSGSIITVSKEAVDTEGEAGGLKAGDRYSVIDLVRIMLTVSSNDAAIALAQAYDHKQLGDEAYDAALNHAALFTAAMQEKARSIGMSETYYGDPSGLSVVNQSVVTDLSLLTDYVAANDPVLFEITRNRQNTALERRSMTRKTFTNINELAGQSDFLGGKTGRTDEAGGNLLSLFSYNGKTYLIIVLGTDDRFGQTRALYNWVKYHAE